jgi:hypothetical protein
MNDIINEALVRGEIDAEQADLLTKEAEKKHKLAKKNESEIEERLLRREKYKKLLNPTGEQLQVLKDQLQEAVGLVATIPHSVKYFIQNNSLLLDEYQQKEFQETINKLLVTFEEGLKAIKSVKEIQ